MSTPSPTIRAEDRDGAETYVLEDPATRSRVVVAPEIGSNVLSFETGVGDRTLGIIAPPPSIAALREHPTWYATPVLFPYPGRISGGRFSFRGRDYQLPVSNGDHAIHGPVNVRAWRVIETRSDVDSAVLTTEIDTESQPDILAEWPFPFSLTETVTLRSGRLRLDLAATNTGGAAMPMGLGLHPYFATPLAGRGDRADNLVAVAAERLWTQSGGIPTGEGVDLPTSGALVSRSLRDLGYQATGVPMRSLNLLYSSFGTTRERDAAAPGGISATIRDAAQEFEVRLDTSATFGALVLFVPPWTTDLSLEPHTCVPDSVNLAARGVETGLIALEPGQTWRGWVEFSASRI